MSSNRTPRAAVTPAVKEDVEASMSLADDGQPRQTFPEFLARLHREQFTGEHLLCWTQGYPRVVKFLKTTEIRLDSGREKG